MKRTHRKPSKSRSKNPSPPAPLPASGARGEGVRTGSKKKGPRQAAGWAALTWDDLDRWAGSRSVSRGQSYQNQGRVKDLVISADDRLLATVQGGDRYVVSVWLIAGKKRREKIESHCTCPVGRNCKHAVATVAAYLQALTEGATVPTADPDDPRWRELLRRRGRVRRGRGRMGRRRPRGLGRRPGRRRGRRGRRGSGRRGSGRRGSGRRGSGRRGSGACHGAANAANTPSLVATE